MVLRLLLSKKASSKFHRGGAALAVYDVQLGMQPCGMLGTHREALPKLNYTKTIRRGKQAGQVLVVSHQLLYWSLLWFP